MIKLKSPLKLLMVLLYMAVSPACVSSNFTSSYVETFDTKAKEYTNFVESCNQKISYLKSMLRSNPPVLPKNILGALSWSEVCGETFDIMLTLNFVSESEKEKYGLPMLDKISTINSRILKNLLYIESVLRCFGDIVQDNELYDLDSLKTVIEQSLGRLETFILQDCKDKDLDVLLNSVYKVLPINSLRSPNLTGKFLLNYERYSEKLDNISNKISAFIKSGVKNYNEEQKYMSYCCHKIKESLIVYSIFTRFFIRQQDREKYCIYIDIFIDICMSMLENSIDDVFGDGKFSLVSMAGYLCDSREFDGVKSIIREISNPKFCDFY